MGEVLTQMGGNPVPSVEQSIDPHRLYEIREICEILHIPRQTFRLDVLPHVDHLTWLSGGASVCIKGSELIAAMERIATSWDDVKNRDRRLLKSSKNAEPAPLKCVGKRAAGGEKKRPR